MAYRDGGRIITDGLVLSLDAADRNSYVSGSTIWRDLSGNNNSGSLTNGPTFSSANEGSIVFDGVDDFVNTNVLGRAIGTLFSFFNPTVSVNSTFFEGLIDCDTAGQYGQGMGINNGTFQTILDNGFWDPSVTVDIGKWQMCALTFNSTTAKFYKNGTLRNTFNYTQGAVTTNNYYIGRSRANNRFINGRIAIATIYNRVLSDTEILQNYNAQKSRFGLT